MEEKERGSLKTNCDCVEWLPIGTLIFTEHLLHAELHISHRAAASNTRISSPTRLELTQMSSLGYWLTILQVMVTFIGMLQLLHFLKGKEKLENALESRLDDKGMISLQGRPILSCYFPLLILCFWHVHPNPGSAHSLAGAFPTCLPINSVLL